MDPFTIAIVTFAFLLGGIVKGIAGMGLPLVTVAVLTFFFDLPTAMAFMLVPGLVANFWQSLSGGRVLERAMGIWTLLVPCLLTIWIGVVVLQTADNSTLILILGLVLGFYAAVSLTKFRIDIPLRGRGIIAPVFGAICGITTGMTGVTSVPSVIYLNGIGLKRDAMIQSMGIFFFTSYVVLNACFYFLGLLTVELGLLSVYAVLPGLVGMEIGKRLRARTSEEQFRRIFLFTLLAIALYMIARSV